MMAAIADAAVRWLLAAGTVVGAVPSGGVRPSSGGGPTGWPLLLAMAVAAVIVGGLSLLFLLRWLGRDRRDQHRTGDDTEPPRGP